MLAIAAAKVLRRKVWLGDIDPVAVAVANANARLNGVGAFCRAIVSRGVESAALREGAPYDLVFANILAKPLRLLAPSLAAVISADGDAIVSGLLLADVRGRASVLAGAGVSSRRADRARGLGEPQTAAVKSAARRRLGLSRFCRPDTREWRAIERGIKGEGGERQWRRYLPGSAPSCLRSSSCLARPAISPTRSCCPASFTW